MTKNNRNLFFQVVCFSFEKVKAHKREKKLHNKSDKNKALILVCMTTMNKEHEHYSQEELSLV